MPILDSHYRNSTPYFEAYKVLVLAARDRQLSHYKPFIELLKLKPGNYAQAQIGILLGELAEDCHHAGYPMISAITVNMQTQRPGTGFYVLAVELGRIPAGLSEAQREAFWRSEVERVYATKWPLSATALKPRKPTS